MSPLEVEMILHYYAASEPYPNEDCPAQQEAIARFEKHDLITKDDESGLYKTTERGEKYVDMLCSTPWPVVRYVDPRKEENQ